MNHLVKILTACDGEPRCKDDISWHLSVDTCGDNSTLCESEFYGLGSSGCEYETKSVKRGGITCPKCLSLIKYIKSVKL